MYLTFGEYIQFYKDVPEQEFNVYRIQAERMMDEVTTGIDGVRKLQEYYPTEDAERFKLAMAETINELFNFAESDKACGYSSTDGTYKGRQIASVSSGSESISYTSGQNSPYALHGAERTAHIMTNITSRLRGVRDSNGVLLLYRGSYNV